MFKKALTVCNVGGLLTLDLISEILCGVPFYFALRTSRGVTLSIRKALKTAAANHSLRRSTVFVKARNSLLPSA